MLLHSGHITAWYSRHDSDIHLIHRRLQLKSDRMENNSHPCAQRILHPFCVVSHSCTNAVSSSKFDLFDTPSRARKIEGGARRPISLQGSWGQTVEMAIPMFKLSSVAHLSSSLSLVASWLVLHGFFVSIFNCLSLCALSVSRLSVVSCLQVTRFAQCFIVVTNCSRVV